jgi:excinuclease UvrABC ATPase subunit
MHELARTALFGLWQCGRAPNASRYYRYHNSAQPELRSRLIVLAPIVVDKKGAFEHVPEQYQRAGFARVRVDGVIYALDEFPQLDKKYKHSIDVVVDRLVNDEASRGRLAQSVEQAL